MKKKGLFSLFDIVYLLIFAVVIFSALITMSNFEEKSMQMMEESLQLQREQVEILKNLEVDIK